MSEVKNTAEAVAHIVLDRVGTIREASGFETDSGRVVYWGKIRVADEDVGAGCTSVIDGVDTVIARPGRIPNNLIEQRFGIVAYVPCSINDPSAAAHAAIRDIKKVIWQGNDSTFGGQVVLVKYLGKDIGARADGAKIVMALVEIGVQFVETLTDP